MSVFAPQIVFITSSILRKHKVDPTHLCGFISFLFYKNILSSCCHFFEVIVKVEEVEFPIEHTGYRAIKFTPELLKMCLDSVKTPYSFFAFFE